MDFLVRGAIIDQHQCEVFVSLIQDALDGFFKVDWLVVDWEYNDRVDHCLFISLQLVKLLV